MPRVFLTKVWGFSPGTYPVLGFNAKGARVKFLRESSPGDWVVLAGTRTAPTKPYDQGRLLGKIQLGSEEIDVESVVRSLGTPIPSDHYNERGRYRWPFGLPVIAAQRFPGKPDLAEVLGNYLPGTQWAAYALDVKRTLGHAMQVRLENLESEAVQIIEAPAIVRQSERQRALLLNTERETTGPGPSNHRSSSQRAGGTAVVYLLQLEGARQSAFKIGYSSDWVARCATLNKGLLTEVTGISWVIRARQAFQTEKQAFQFEQILHRRLCEHRIKGEQEVYSIDWVQMNRVWTDVFAKAEWVTSDEQYCG